MHNNKVLKRLLAVTAIAAMFSAFGVHAQAGKDTQMGSSSAQSTKSSSPNVPGKTTTEGTMGNNDSQGMDQHGTKSSGASGASGSTGASSMSKGDEKILQGMAQANIDEIEAAKLAQSKSQNDQVKSFAQQMIDDHTKALNDVQQLAQQKGVTLPTEPDAKHKAMSTKLEAMSGAAFDKAYMSQAGVSDHKAVHSKLMSDEKKAKDADLKALAQKMLPVVEQHLKSAEQDKSAMAGTKSGK